MTKPIFPVPLRPLPRLIFATRWLQLPLYIGLTVAQVVYVAQFIKELIPLVQFHEFMKMDEHDIMLAVLGLIDVVMISNLLVMVIVGGYETFVSRLGLEGHPDQPEWLSHVNAGLLKVKLAMAIVGISSIHLLRTFIGASKLGLEGAEQLVTPEGIKWQAILHVIFVLSALGIAFMDRLSNTPAPHAAGTAPHD
ncbi:MAG: TIGR00645 family protein [Planctomycetota bacterium]